MVLIIVSAIAVVVVSYLMLIRHETRISGYEVEQVRADLAAKAAFEEAKSLLVANCADDHYLITALTNASGVRSENGVEMPWRYTFLSHPNAELLDHVPLFSGGRQQRVPMPKVSAQSTESLATAPLGQPLVTFLDGVEMIETIETFGLSHSIEGRWVPENREVPVGLIDMPDGDGAGEKKYHVRYAYWIEDLQGYPNLDVGGLWTDFHESDSGDGQRTFDQIRLGYGVGDMRSLADLIPQGGGARVELAAGSSEYGYQFPRAFRGQRLFDQIAPGLSPREMHVYPWESSAGQLAEHPFAQAAHLASSRQFVPTGVENRFVVGLKPYLERPMIPFGHDYKDAGKTRTNLNRLVADRLVSSTGGDGGIVETIRRNLPDFADERRGAFPVEEDYLATLAANMIDYADADNTPSLASNASHTGQTFRGIDSYPVVNEFFVKFSYEGYEIAGGDFKVTFKATPWVEFWNPSNRHLQMQGLRLKFRIIERLQFDGPGFGNVHRLDGMENPAINSDGAFDNPISVGMEPNEFRVVEFGDIEWQFLVDRKGTQSFQIVPGIYNLSSSGTKRGTSRAHYELYWNGEKIDSSGRAFPGDRATPPEHGFFLLPLVDGKLGSSLEPSDMQSNGDAQVQTGEYMIRATAAGLGTSKGSPNGSHFGDSWMSYYSAGTQEHEYYTRDASPGGRNYRFDKVEAPARTDVFRDQQRFLDWPDRGYESAPPPAPAKKSTVLPVAVAPAPLEPAFAPWRISNLGRYFSLSELGNIHDPHMWRGQATAELSNYARNPVSMMRYDRMIDGQPLKKNLVWDLPAGNDPKYESVEDAQFGGGSTLRIGRREFSLFDRNGLRASQLLDLFHVGEAGTNLPFGSLGPDHRFTPDDSADSYRAYDPRDHQPPPTAPDADTALERPYSDVYPPELHAQGDFRRVYGHLNLNATPSAIEIEALLRGPFTSSDILAERTGPGQVNYTRPTDVATLEKSLDSEAVGRVAERLFRLRPFYSPSHIARVLGELLEEEDALPDFYNDAEAEETFARLYNATTLSSRHFRIFAYGEVTDPSGQIAVGRSIRVYEVYLRANRDSAGEIVNTACEVLSVREL